MAATSSSVLYAEFRRGLKDLQCAILNAWNGVTQTHEEAGTIGNPTQQVITTNIQGRDDFNSMANEYAERSAPETTQKHERER